MVAQRNFEEVLSFWFEEIQPRQWFQKDPEFDGAIQERFGALVRIALAGELSSWTQSAESNLALILVLDQFTRNIFRGTAKSYSGDEAALEASLTAVRRGDLVILHERLPERYAQFLLMPMMHSESLDVQNRSLPLFAKYCSERTYDYAVRHMEVIARFGRFPHRNDLLGRESTAEEMAFLSQPGSSF